MRNFEKIFFSMIAMIMMVIVGGVFTSCTNDDNQFCTGENQTEQVLSIDKDATSITVAYNDSNEFGIPSYPAGTITLSDFENQKHFFTKEELNNKLKDGYLGNAAENALVVLLFNKDGILVTPYEFNYSLRCKIDFEKEGYRTFFTNLKTFYSVTRLEQAKGIYARCASGIWIFDHLAKFYLTEKDIAEKLKAKEYEMISLGLNLRTSVQDYFIKGNMLSGKFGFTGKLTPHIAGITSNLSASYGTVNTALSYLYVTEALPPGEANSVIKHIATDTSTDGDWAKPSTYERKVLFPKPLLGLSSSTMNQISSYIDSQIGKPYDFEGKLILDSFYCSKLVWIAYYLKANVDIDTDGGYWVWPNDIIIDDDIAYLTFGLSFILFFKETFLGLFLLNKRHNKYFIIHQRINQIYDAIKQVHIINQIDIFFPKILYIKYTNIHTIVGIKLSHIEKEVNHNIISNKKTRIISIGKGLDGK